MFESIKEFKFIRNVLPGDYINEEGIMSMNIVDKKAIVAGKLLKIENTFFIFSKTLYYVPEKGDIVIGRIFSVNQDYYRVNIGSEDLKIPQHTGILPVLSFENATKRNKPELFVNDLVMCKIVDVKECEVLLSCQEKELGKIENAFKLDKWKILLLHFMDIRKEINTFYKIEKSFKISLGMNGYINLEGKEYEEIKNAITQIIK